MEDRSTRAAQNCWYSCMLFITTLIIKPILSVPFTQFLLYITEKSRNCLRSGNIKLNVNICGDGPSKSNETKIFARSVQGRWIFILGIELNQALFYVKNLPSWIPLIIWAVSLQRKTWPFFFLCFLLPTLRSVLLLQKSFISCISKRICYFSVFICHLRETRGHC